ncbi:MAG: Tn3 family transposase, partial [Sulfuricaulis sp.]
RGRRREELIAVSGSLRLLTNICLAWTTHRIDAAIAANPELHQPEFLAHMSPAHPGNINFRGIFQFPFAAYRERLLAPVSMRAGSARLER